MEVGVHIDVNPAQRKVWDVARLQIDSMGVLGKHNGQGSAVDTPGEQMLNRMSLRWRGCTLELLQAESRWLSSADQLERWRVMWRYARHPILLMTVSSP